MMKKFIVILICLTVMIALYLKILGGSATNFGVKPNILAKPVKGAIIKTRSDEGAKFTLLYYSFQFLHADYSFVPKKLKLLQQIAAEYKKLGSEDNYQALTDLYNKYKEDTISTSYLASGFPSYQKTWANVQESAEDGRFDEAIVYAKNDPYALANIAQEIYKQTGDEDKSRELVDRAFKEFQKGEYDQGHLTGIAKGYSLLKEYEEAYAAMSLAETVQFWGSTTVPAIRYYAEKNKMEEAITLVTKTTNGDGRAEGLLYMAQNIRNSQAPLDEKYIQILNSVLK